MRGLSPRMHDVWSPRWFPPDLIVSKGRAIAVKGHRTCALAPYRGGLPHIGPCRRSALRPEPLAYAWCHSLDDGATVIATTVGRVRRPVGGIVRKRWPAKCDLG